MTREDLYLYPGKYVICVRRGFAVSKDRKFYFSSDSETTSY
jgi:hypothetical protein